MAQSEMAPSLHLVAAIHEPYATVGNVRSLANAQKPAYEKYGKTEQPENSKLTHE